MKRYVISAPRSGLNWTRFCVEYFLGLRTPGKPLLITGKQSRKKAFIRTHDALLLTKKKGGSAYQYIDPASTAGDKVALIIRDPLESYVRMARRRFSLFDCYIGNIRFFAQAAATDKYAVYYDDIVASPEKMAEFLEFLDLTPADGYERLSLAGLQSGWDKAGDASRALYNKNQWHSGGAKTGNNPLDFSFHQRKLSPSARHRVWRYLIANLDETELALLDRYRMDGDVEPATMLEKLLRLP